MRYSINSNVLLNTVISKHNMKPTEITLSDTTQVMVYSDLDGTLLDHYTYSFEPALTCMNALKSKHIPIIPNTSKTFDEVISLRRDLNLDTPLIVENGAAIYIPKNFFPTKPKDTKWHKGFWVKSFANKRSHWQSLLQKLKKDYEGKFETFGDMDISRIMEVTGLDKTSAIQSSNREFGEPLLWFGTDQEKQNFIEVLRSKGASPLVGGRFLHVCGDSNKGKALQWLVKEQMRQVTNKQVISIALGDGNNDVDMLECADYAVRIASPANPPPQLSRTNKLYTSTLHGPEGWSEIMFEIIPELNIGNR